MGRWLDQSLDDITSKTLPTLGLRLTIGMAASIMTIWTLGWRTAAIWTCANIVCELWIWRTSLPQRRGSGQTQMQRLWYLASVAAMNLAWSGLAIALWRSDHPALQVCAICLLASQMLHASIFSSASKVLVAIVGGIPALVVLGLTTIGSAELGAYRLFAGPTAAMMVGYLFWSAWTARRNADAVEAARLAAIDANEAKGRFLAMISHELRTPMTGILGMAQALDRAPLAPDQARQVQVMLQSSETLLRLLNDILDLSKIGAGKLELEDAPFDLPAAVFALSEFWRPAADAKGLTLRCQVQSEEAEWVLGDGPRLRQVVDNLLSNAIKFTAEGEVELSLRAQAMVGERVALEIAVRDTGLGLTEAEISRLFQPFTQADASIARRFGGTGLGLSICKQLVTAMGGALTVRSRPGEGSTFVLTLDLPRMQKPAPAPKTQDHALLGLRVLLVDDNETNRLVGATLLGTLGCHVTTLDGAEAALDHLQRDIPDILLLDIHMPGMNGVELLREIRLRRLLPSDTPVVALTADAQDEKAQRLLEAGFDAVESKPIRSAALAVRMMELLASRASDVIEAVIPRGARADGMAAEAHASEVAPS